MRILLSRSHDPYFNLAVESFIFQTLHPDAHVLFLWRNADTVVIGKGQNPWAECNLNKMESDNVKLARRQSGGGAVFHDLGNTNFTFMSRKPDYDKSVSTEIVLRAVRQEGIEAEASGRNDLVINYPDGPRKFSGSAFRETKDRGFHHGTLLIDTDLTRLANYLNPDRRKLESKGIKSVRSRVCNLRELNQGIDHESLCHRIRTEFCNHHQREIVPEFIDPEHITGLPGFGETFARQSDRNWNFGKSPRFSHRLDERFHWGGVDVHLDVKNAVVCEATIFTDCLFPDSVLSLANELVGLPYSEPRAFQHRLEDWAARQGEHRESAGELARWLLGEIEGTGP